MKKEIEEQNQDTRKVGVLKKGSEGGGASRFGPVRCLHGYLLLSFILLYFTHISISKHVEKFQSLTVLKTTLVLKRNTRSCYILNIFLEYLNLIFHLNKIVYGETYMDKLKKNLFQFYSILGLIHIYITNISILLQVISETALLINEMKFCLGSLVQTYFKQTQRAMKTIENIKFEIYLKYIEKIERTNGYP